MREFSGPLCMPYARLWETETALRALDKLGTLPMMAGIDCIAVLKALSELSRMRIVR
jgi:hypothetical protein